MEGKKLPDSWVITEIGRVFKVLVGATPSRANKDYWNGNIPWVSSGEVAFCKIKVAREHISEAGLSNSSTTLHPRGTVLIGMIGEGKTRGQVAILDIEACNNQNSAAIRVSDTEVSPEFIYYYLLGSYHKNRNNSSGNNQPALNKERVRQMELPLAPLPEQRRIVAKLEELFSRLDAGVATLRQTQAQLKRYRQSVLHAAVTGELTRAWRAAGPAQSQKSGAALLQRIRQERRAQWEATQVAKRGGQLPLNDTWKSKYEEPAAPDTSELPELPEGWVWATTEQLCSSVASGSTPQAHELFADQGEVPFLKVYNLTKIGKLDFTVKPTFIRREVHNGLLNRSKANPGDILINIVGPPLGKVSIVPDDFLEWNINQAIVAFKPVPAFSNHFLLACLLTETIMKWLLNTAKTTTSQVNLSVTACRQLPLPVPPLAEQAEIVAEVERRLSVLDNLECTLAAELTRAERLRQSVLHRAFTGQLVPQDPTDEPAAALLARLQAAPAGPPAAPAKRGCQPKATQTTLAL